MMNISADWEWGAILAVTPGSPESAEAGVVDTSSGEEQNPKKDTLRG